MAGRVTEVQRFGTTMLRIDIPSDPPATQFYGGASIYAVTPTTEAIARAFATRTAPAPISRWELQPERALPQDGWRGATADELDDDDEPEDAVLEEPEDDRPF
jgi:hypothetical protein